MKRLIFDTETTGYMPDNPDAPIEEWPYVVQLAASMVDGDQFVDKYEAILNWNGVMVPEEAAKVHGISTDIMRDQGTEPLEVIKRFDAMVREADMVGAFNLAFDLPVMLRAYQRVNGTGGALQASGKFCVLQSSVLACRIPGTEKQKVWGPADRRYWKNPNLREAYEILVDSEGFVGAHSADADTDATVAVMLVLLDKGFPLFYEDETEPRARQSPQNRANRANSEDVETLQAVLEWVDAWSDEALNDWELGFINDYREKFEKYGERVFISDKQAATLKRIAETLGVE